MHFNQCQTHGYVGSFEYRPNCCLNVNICLFRWISPFPPSSESCQMYKLESHSCRPAQRQQRQCRIVLLEPEVGEKSTSALFEELENSDLRNQTRTPSDAHSANYSRHQYRHDDPFCNGEWREERVQRGFSFSSASPRNSAVYLHFESFSRRRS